MYLESDNNHFLIANDTLFQAIQESLIVATELGFSNLEIQLLTSANIPTVFDWHHSENPVVLQLVNEETHQYTGHTDGREIWGGGSGYRKFDAKYITSESFISNLLNLSNIACYQQFLYYNK